MAHPKDREPMTQFLLELFSEEIPARFQEKAETDLATSIQKKLEKGRISYDTIQSFSTPRRLGLHITGLPTVQEDHTKERKGPAISAPPAAIEGFLKSVGLKRAQCEEKMVNGKGPFLFATLSQKGEDMPALLARITEETIHEFSWPKSMRWLSNEFTWARPLHGILALFNGAVVPVKINALGLSAQNHTFGHRFLSPQKIDVESFEDYTQKLRAHYVIINPRERKEIIKQQIDACLPNNIRLLDDHDLLVETANLVEWPVVLLGKIDAKFMTLPREVLVTSMKVHQRYFATIDEKGHLAPYFMTVSNMETADQGQQIIEGNERVLRARLSDAAFFWHQDMKVPLETHNDPLKNRIFQKDLGTVYDKVKRLQKMVKPLTPHFPHVNENEAETTITLLKADLSTGMVGEFPELQGIMGGYYAKAHGHPDTIAEAIKTHYAPEGPQAPCPQKPLSYFVALVDKIDSLVGFFGVGLIPTASKDPYGLRRLTLGIIRIIYENELTVSIDTLIEASLATHQFKKSSLKVDLKNFITDRLETYLKNIFDIQHIRAIMGDTWDGSITLMVHKLDALKQFLESPKGADFLVVFERTANILKDQHPTSSLKESALEAEEKALLKAVDTTEKKLSTVLSNPIPNYTHAIEAIATLAPPLSVFFNNIMVMDVDPVKKSNRISLLKRVYSACMHICDIQKLHS